MIHDLLNVTQSNGPDIANITIRDPATGRVKAEGLFNSWGRDDWLQGTVVGVVRDEGGGAEETTGSGNWIANVRVQFGRGVVIDIGSTASTAQPAAGIFSGGCPGVKYVEFDFDIGAASSGSSISTMGAASGGHRRSGM